MVNKLLCRAPPYGNSAGRDASTHCRWPEKGIRVGAYLGPQGKRGCLPRAPLESVGADQSLSLSWLLLR